jgi:hypothetical protein
MREQDWDKESEAMMPLLNSRVGGTLPGEYSKDHYESSNWQTLIFSVTIET